MLEIRCIDIYGRNIFCLLRLGYQEIVTGTPSTSFPLTDEALQYPQTRDVLQEADMSTHAAFVGKPCTAGLFGQHRLVQGDTQQRHVPELRKALTASFPLRKGTACTALAVS